MSKRQGLFNDVPRQPSGPTDGVDIKMEKMILMVLGLQNQLKSRMKQVLHLQR